MSLWSRVAGLFRRKMTPDEWFREFGGSLGSATGIYINQLTALQASAVMACVSILSEDMAKLPLHVFRRGADGGKDVVADHPIERVLQKPNGWQDRFEFVEQMMAALLLRGNAYAAVLRDWRGQVQSLVPINPDKVVLYQSTNGELFYIVSRTGPHEMAALKSLPLMIAAEDMFHLRWLTLNSLVGVSRIGVAREIIGLALGQQDMMARFIGNGAHNGVALQTDKHLSDDVYKRLVESWRDRQSGISNAGKTAILEEGLKLEKLGMSLVDAEFMAARQFQTEEIGRIFRIPPNMLGVSGSRATNSTIEQAGQDYANNTLGSYVERWESKINDFFGLSDEGLFAEFDMNRFLRASIVNRMNAYRVAIMSSVMTPNQASRAEGLPDDPAGDVRLQPANMVPLGSVTSPASAAAGPGSDTTGAPADGGHGDPAGDPADPADPADNPDDAPQG